MFVVRYLRHAFSTDFVTTVSYFNNDFNNCDVMCSVLFVIWSIVHAARCTGVIHRSNAIHPYCD